MVPKCSRAGPLSSSLRSLRVDAGTILNLIRSVHDYDFSSVKFRADRGICTLGVFDRYIAYPSSLTRIHNVHIRSLGTLLNGRGRYHGRILLGVQQEVYVYKLIRKKRIVPIIEHRLE